MTSLCSRQTIQPALRKAAPSKSASSPKGVVDLLAPSWADDAAKRRWWARGERLAGGPGYFKAVLDLFLHTDIRPALASIQAPTLVLHRRGDRHVVTEHAKYVADRIPNARLVEFDGDDNVWFAGDTDRVLDEIESFVTTLEVDVAAFINARIAQIRASL